MRTAALVFVLVICTLAVGDCIVKSFTAKSTAHRVGVLLAMLVNVAVIASTVYLWAT